MTDFCSTDPIGDRKKEETNEHEKQKSKDIQKIPISHFLASLAALYPGRSVIHGVEFEGVKHVEVSPNSYDSDWKRLWSHMFTNYHLFVIFTNSPFLFLIILAMFHLFTRFFSFVYLFLSPFQLISLKTSLPTLQQKIPLCHILLKASL